MRTIKVKALLLSLVAVLTLGLTSCTDELGDQTQGKPGYLTLNLKTLKPKQTKVAGDSVNDFQFIKDLNIFVFDNSSKLLLNKYYDDGSSGIVTTFNINGTENSFSIKVGTLPAGSYVVAVANYGSRMNHVIDSNSLVNTTIETVRNFETLGLHMTGKADIETSGDGYTYTSRVKIAPVESKITVNWTLYQDVASWYDVTGIYISNVIDTTLLPIIRNNYYNGTTWDATATNITPKDYINIYSSNKRTAKTGYTPIAAKDFNFYGSMGTPSNYLYDEKSSQITNEILDLGYTKFGDTTTSKFHYYVGENYSNNTKPNSGTGSIYANNTSNHANTIVLMRVTPKSTAPDYIKAMGHKYYTYEFDKNSAVSNNTVLGSGQISTNLGFSVRRKSNYNLKFVLNDIGSDIPFERLKTLNVIVTAEGWDDQTIPVNF